MVNSEGTTTWNYKGADNIDGADITAIEIYTDGTIGGRFTTENGWKIENGKLPGLDAPVDMPDHLSPFVNAKIPTISAQPKNATIGLGTTGATYDLAVIASVIDSGVLSYQWYTNTTASNTGGTAIAGATSATYTASINTDAEKKFYYYVIITNKINDNGDGGRKTSTVASNIATVTVTRINAQVPTIVTQPASAEVPKGAAGSVRNLTVETSVNDGGTLSYQWYVNTTASNTDGIAIEGATKQNYNAPIDKEIVFYYYVVITNSITDNGDGGQKTAIVSSSPARLAVIVTNAQSPVITVHPASVQLPLGETGAVRSLAVAANVAGGGTLSYQWYANTTASNIGGEMIDGATGMVYAAPVDIEGTFYYYVVVTNNITDNGDGGRKSAAAASNVAILGIGVSAINAQVPAITAQPANATVAVGTTRNLTVAASVADDGILRYQWYTNTVASNSGGTKIDGATSATYTALINAEETFYYYVIVTNTINDNGDGGQKTVTTISNVAALKGTLGVSVQSRDRIIPVVNPNAEATVVAPVNQLTAEFTAGPNPVNRNCGVVNFYRQGKRIDSGTLTIYDASGNVIRKIAIRDDDATAGTRRAVSLQSSEHPNIQSRRPVGTWDLVDRRGRLVSDGTYLVKGVVVASDGKKERVSLKVGVR